MSETILHHKKIIDVVKYRWVWFGLSLLLIVPGLVAMIYSVMTYPSHLPVKVGIDFTLCLAPDSLNIRAGLA